MLKAKQKGKRRKMYYCSEFYFEKELSFDYSSSGIYTDEHGNKFKGAMFNICKNDKKALERLAEIEQEYDNTHVTSYQVAFKKDGYTCGYSQPQPALFIAY